MNRLVHSIGNTVLIDSQEVDYCKQKHRHTMEVAIYADCQRLFHSFVKNENPQFTVFRVEWQTLGFQYIYSAQTCTSEILQTTETALQVAKHEFCVSRPDETEAQKQLRHIAALYLMYVIYFKQPTKNYVKIEVSMTTWSQMQQFIRSIPKEIQFDDVRYVFTKLIHANAFRFTALDYCVGLEGLVDYNKLFEARDEMTEGDIGLHQKMKSFKKAQTLLPIFTILEDGYNEMKEQIIKTKNVDKKTLPPTTIFKEVNELFNNFSQILEGSNKIVPENSGIRENTRQAIKRKSFAVSASDKEKKKSVDDMSHAVPFGPTRRMSSKTIFSEQLPEDTVRDLCNTSSDIEAQSTDADGSELEFL